MDEWRDKKVRDAAQALVSLCHEAAALGGWWRAEPDGTDPRNNKYHFSTKLMLVVTELAEACEGHRKNLMDDHLPHRKMVEVELADAVIRIMDLAGGYGLDLAGAIAEKMAYNQQRADHKPENRDSAGGKSY